MDLITMILACGLYTNNSVTNAVVQVGSQNNELTITSQGGNPTVFPTKQQAINYANNELKIGHVIEVGLMQIPSFWFNQYRVTPKDLLEPCKNIVVGTEILNQAVSQCQQMSNMAPNNIETCALSVYKTGNATAGLNYAKMIEQFATKYPFVKPKSTLEEPKPNATTAPAPSAVTPAPSQTTTPTTAPIIVPLTPAPSTSQPPAPATNSDNTNDAGTGTDNSSDYNYNETNNNDTNADMHPNKTVISNTEDAGTTTEIATNNKPVNFAATNW